MKKHSAAEFQSIQQIWLQLDIFSWQLITYLIILLEPEFDGVVRLTDGDGVTSGRVEIFHDGAWGVVCDRDWDFKDATTVCNQLGFIEALEAKDESFFGGSADLPAVMDRVTCTGTEDMLSDCPFVCPSAKQCIKAQTVGVICKPSESYFYIPISDCFSVETYRIL